MYTVHGVDTELVVVGVLVVQVQVHMCQGSSSSTSGGPDNNTP